MSIISVFTILDPLTGPAFWQAYHQMDAADQGIANWELNLDAILCGWSPGPDTWQPPTIPQVIVPSLPSIPITPPMAIPEASTWLMLMLGLIALAIVRGKNHANSRHISATIGAQTDDRRPNQRR